jgi:hypothetical protein
VLVAPAAGVGGIHPDHGDAAPGGHRRQPGTKPGGGYTSDGAAQPFSAFATAKRISADCPRIGEVEVLHHDRRTVLLLGVIEHSRDRRAHPAITPRRRQPAGRHLDADRGADRVARRIEHTAGEMAVVEVHPEHPTVA